MRSLILKIATIGLVATLLYVSTGCDGRRPPRKVKKILSSSEIKKGVKAPAEQKKRTSDVGVGDVADYATGATQLKAKKRSETRLKNIYSTHSKEREKALQEK